MRVLLAGMAILILVCTLDAQSTALTKDHLIVARGGDTIATLAERYALDAVELAKFNGLLPNSILASGRTIKVPSKAGTADRCDRKLSDLAEIRGLRLGMPKAAVLDYLKPEARALGGELSYIADHMLKSPEQANGIRNLRLDFFEDKLLKFSVWYSHETNWSSDAEFANVIADRLMLPSSAWRESGIMGRKMDCREFSVLVGSDTLTIEDTRASEEKAAADRSEIERRKKAFKP